MGCHSGFHALVERHHGEAAQRKRTLRWLRWHVIEGVVAVIARRHHHRGLPADGVTRHLRIGHRQFASFGHRPQGEGVSGPSGA